jgi:hypothetical protein
MPHSNTIYHSARRASVSGKSDRPPARAQKNPQPQQTQKPQPVLVDDDDAQYVEADRDDIELPETISSKARQAIELLREERQLEQALRDTFDY